VPRRGWIFEILPGNNICRPRNCRERIFVYTPWVLAFITSVWVTPFPFVPLSLRFVPLSFPLVPDSFLAGPRQDPEAAGLVRRTHCQGKRIANLEDRLAAVQMSAALSPSVGGLMAGLSDDELRRLTPEELENLSDRQLHAVAIHLRAVDERSGAAFTAPCSPIGTCQQASRPKLPAFIHAVNHAQLRIQQPTRDARPLGRVDHSVEFGA